MTDIVAIYAAVVASATGGWQAYTWHRDRAVRVRLHVDLAEPVGGNGPSVVLVTLTNDSAFPVRWMQAGFDTQDQSDQFVMIGLPPQVAEHFEPLPRVVNSHDAATTGIEAAALAAWGFDLTQPLVAQATLANRQQIRSDPKTLASSLVFTELESTPPEQEAGASTS